MIVVDCSLVLSGILSDEENKMAEKIFTQLSRGKLRAMVPAHFYLEAQNVLLSAFRKKRIHHKTWDEYLEVLAELPLEVDQPERNKRYFSTIAALSTEHQLTVYDAVYLEVAKRHKAKLATLDKQLQIAADKNNVLYSS